MKTTIPKNSGPDYGLVFTMGTWKCHFSRDSKRYYRSLKTTDRETARERRDALYAALAAAGAAPPDRRAVVRPDDDSGIYRTKPSYAVKIHGVHIGTAPTRELARRLKREYLLTQSDNLTQ